MSERVKGKVKWFNASKGYGFLERPNGEADVFVRKNDIENPRIDSETVGSADYRDEHCDQGQQGFDKFVHYFFPIGPGRWTAL